MGRSVRVSFVSPTSLAPLECLFVSLALKTPPSSGKEYRDYTECTKSYPVNC